MKPGSVIVDLAGETGGNCELTEPGEIVVKHDVTIVSPLNLPATMPEHASQLYARNVAGAARAAARRRATRRRWRWTSTTRSSPAPASRATARSSTRPARETPWRSSRLMLAHQPRDPRARRLRRLRRHLQGAEHAAHAADVGHQRDPRHRPARRPARARRSPATARSTRCILVIAIAFGTINVVGGFLVTDRMLEMFKGKPTAPPSRPTTEDGSDRSHARSSDRTSSRPLHRRLRAVHLRADAG